jgi:RNase P subunit RPR2
MKRIVYLILLCYGCMFLRVVVFVFHVLSRSQLDVRISWSCLYCLHVRRIRVGYVEKELLSKDFSVRASK